MELKIKEFGELTAEELFRIYRIRSEVFVAEQQSPYQDVDDGDLRALHIWLEEDGQLEAYARLVPPGTSFSECAIGRVVSRVRGRGTGTLIMKAAISEAEKRYSPGRIRIEAQVQAEDFYRRFGFVRSSEPFDDSGVLHVEMLKEI